MVVSSLSCLVFLQGTCTPFTTRPCWAHTSPFSQRLTRFAFQPSLMGDVPGDFFARNAALTSFRSIRKNNTFPHVSGRYLNDMGLVYADIALKNPRLPDIKPLEVKSLVDSGALMLCLPDHVATQLSLEKQEDREATTADGKTHLVPYVGPVEICFGDRHCYVGALVMGDEVLLGAVPMEDMDLIICPAHRNLVVNPDSPNFPSALVK